MNGVSHITCIEDVVLITLRSQQGPANLFTEIFQEFAKEQVIIDMISQTAPQGSSVDISFTVHSPQMVTALQVISRVRDRYSQLQIMASTGNCKLHLYGEEMRDISGVAATALASLVQAADILMITTSEVDISLVIPAASLEKSLEQLEQTFGVKAQLQ